MRPSQAQMQAPQQVRQQLLQQQAQQQAQQTVPQRMQGLQLQVGGARGPMYQQIMQGGAAGSVRQLPEQDMAVIQRQQMGGAMRNPAGLQAGVQSQQQAYWNQSAATTGALRRPSDQQMTGQLSQQQGLPSTALQGQYLQVAGASQSSSRPQGAQGNYGAAVWLQHQQQQQERQQSLVQQSQNQQTHGSQMMGSHPRAQFMQPSPQRLTSGGVSSFGQPSAGPQSLPSTGFPVSAKQGQQGQHQSITQAQGRPPGMMQGGLEGVSMAQRPAQSGMMPAQTSQQQFMQQQHKSGMSPMRPGTLLPTGGAVQGSLRTSSGGRPAAFMPGQQQSVQQTPVFGRPAQGSSMSMLEQAAAPPQFANLPSQSQLQGHLGLQQQHQSQLSSHGPSHSQAQAQATPQQLQSQQQAQQQAQQGQQPRLPNMTTRQRMSSSPPSFADHASSFQQYGAIRPSALSGDQSSSYSRASILSGSARVGPYTIPGSVSPVSHPGGGLQGSVQRPSAPQGQQLGGSATAPSSVFMRKAASTGTGMVHTRYIPQHVIEQQKQRQQQLLREAQEAEAARLARIASAPGAAGLAAAAEAEAAEMLKDFDYTECSLRGILDLERSPNADTALVRVLAGTCDTDPSVVLWKDELWRRDGAGINYDLVAGGIRDAEVWVRKYILPEHLAGYHVMRIFSQEHVAVPPHFPTNARRVKELSLHSMPTKMLRALGFRRHPANDSYVKGWLAVRTGTAAEHRCLAYVLRHYKDPFLDAEAFPNKCIVELKGRADVDEHLDMIGKELVEFSRYLQPYTSLVKL